MDFKQLRILYPLGRVQKQKSTKSSDLALYNGQEYYVIPKNILSNSEIHLLQSLTIRQEKSTPWYEFLVHQVIPAHLESKSFQVLHFKVDNLQEDPKLWLESFTSFIPNVVESFFLDEQYGICVLGQPMREQNLIEGFLATLDDDFGTKTSIFIGIYAPADKTFPYIYEEERTIFTENYQNKKIQSFKSLYIGHYLKSTLSNSTYVRIIKQHIYSIEDMESVIRTMWDQQGNITSTAQALFIHRNTLNYRIDRFYELSGLQLRRLDDLLLCYLITN